ncbi:MAG TPA: hypothetical protein VIO86_10685 [Candidatus Dormibacteraeota bacterium]
MGENEPKIGTRHGEVSLEEIAGLLPGAGDIMVVVSRVYGNLWHAAQGGNWDLASFYFRRTRTLLRNLSITRPKYAAQLAEYERDHLEPIGEALIARDRDGFERLYEASVTRANELHVVTGYPYIRWSRPEEPPDPGLDLGPDN